MRRLVGTSHILQYMSKYLQFSDKFVDIALAALIPATILLHLICSPYTKVEESFNIQATHDILNHGVRPLFNSTEAGRLHLKDQYDHLTFTGPVPRTFVGALALAGTSWPFTKTFEVVNGQIIGMFRYSALSPFQDNARIDYSCLVRATLGFWNAFCLLYYRHAVGRAFGRSTANWFAAFQASGFHLIYYASRTLPNIFAFGLGNIFTIAVNFESGILITHSNNCPRPAPPSRTP